MSTVIWLTGRAVLASRRAPHGEEPDAGLATGEVPETIVSDAEPLVAYFCDEPGSDTAETYIAAVMESSEGCISNPG